MKNMTFLICIFFSVAINAQDISGLGKISFEVKLYHPLTDALTNLDKIVAVRNEKINRGIMGVGGTAKLTYEIEGEKATLRLNADSAIFVIEQGTGMFSMDTGMIAFDASSSIMLYKFDSNGGKRVAVIGDYKSQVNPLEFVSNRFAKEGKVTDTRITISSKELKKGLTQILPKNRLTKGEYAFVGGSEMPDQGDITSTKNIKFFVYTFGID